MAKPIGGEHKLVEQSLVFPATRRTPTSLPLTFLDLPFAGPIYAKRLFFYPFPHSTNHFCKTTLPSLKQSLSCTLQHFFPLAGHLISPPPPQKPFIRCTEEDSVSFTFIESSADFNHLSNKHRLKNLKENNHLAPILTHKTRIEDINDIDNDTFTLPLLALQVSVFPNHGVCIGVTYCHVMDGNGCNHFMKSWSFLHQGGDVAELKSPPCFDREVLRDPRGLEDLILRDYFFIRKSWKFRLIAQSKSTGEHEDSFKVIISFGKEEIDGMKKWVMNQWKKNDNEINVPKFLSKFVVTSAFVWASMVKAINRTDDGDEKDEYFCFTCDCRDRLEYPIPEGYFGNCVVSKSATMKRKDMKGKNSFVDAVKVIEKAVNEIKSEPLKDVEDWFELTKTMYMSGNQLFLHGSPKFNVYETDFGFGRPVKVEMVHAFQGVSLAESGDGEGGLEFGLVLKSEEFEYFSSLIQQGLEAFKY